MRKYLLQEVEALADIFGVRMCITAHWCAVDDHEMKYVNKDDWGEYCIVLEKKQKVKQMFLRIADYKGEYYWADDDWRPKLLAIMEDWSDEKAD